MLSQPGLPISDLDEPLVRQHANPAPRRAIHISGYDREGKDFDATPPWVTEALLQHVRFRAPVWEPCCGDGAMSSVLSVHGYDVFSPIWWTAASARLGSIFCSAAKCLAAAGASSRTRPTAT